MSKMKQPLLFGEVLFDCFEDGSRVLGGAPFNVAWHLQAFGAAPLFVSRVGDDAGGREIRATMERWGMSTAGLQLGKTHASGEVAITLQAGQPHFEIIADRAWDYIDGAALPQLSPSLIYHGTLALRQPTSAQALQRLLAEQQAPIFVDINLREPWWNKQSVAHCLDRAQWVKLNDIELHALVAGEEELIAKARHLQQRHAITILIVTRGAAGAFALDPQGNLVDAGPVPATTVVDTVGAGDGFAAVCLLGLLYEWPLPLTLQRAQQFAARLVAQHGAISSDTALYRTFHADWQLKA